MVHEQEFKDLLSSTCQVSVGFTSSDFTDNSNPLTIVFIRNLDYPAIDSHLLSTYHEIVFLIELHADLLLLTHRENISNQFLEKCRF